MNHKSDYRTIPMDWEKALEKLSLSADVSKWYKEMGEDFLRRVGIKENDTVLDFGSRVGHYTVPAARVVGSRGSVYAIDMNHDAIDELERRTEAFDLSDIVTTMRTDGSLQIALPDDSVSCVLFLDVIRSLLDVDGTLEPLKTLLLEFKRVLVNNGILVVYVKHIEDTDYNLADISRLVRESFSLESVLTHRIMHWNYLVDDTVQVYRLR